MSTTMSTCTMTSEDMYGKTVPIPKQEVVETANTQLNGTVEKPRPVKFRSKYKHVEALHKTERPSILSHDSKDVPSFLGFRNLMVLTISQSSPDPGRRGNLSNPEQLS